MRGFYSAALVGSGLFLLLSMAIDRPDRPFDSGPILCLMLVSALGLHFGTWAERHAMPGPPRVPTELHPDEARALSLEYQRTAERLEEQAEEYRATIKWLSAWAEVREGGPVPGHRPPPIPPQKGVGELR